MKIILIAILLLLLWRVVYDRNQRNKEKDWPFNMMRHEMAHGFLEYNPNTNSFFRIDHKHFENKHFHPSTSQHEFINPSADIKSDIHPVWKPLDE